MQTLDLFLPRRVIRKYMAVVHLVADWLCTDDIDTGRCHAIGPFIRKLYTLQSAYQEDDNVCPEESQKSSGCGAKLLGDLFRELRGCCALSLNAKAPRSAMNSDQTLLQNMDLHSSV